MDKTLIKSILRSWEHQRDYAERLVADLPDDQLVAQPVPGQTMNHAAWILGHLSAYPPVLTAMLQNAPFEDPANHPCGRDSHPLSDRAAYPPKAQIVAHYLTVHDGLSETLADIDPSILQHSTPLARWQERFPHLSDACIHLMLHHEGVHLGQLSAWRRAMGLPSV